MYSWQSHFGFCMPATDSDSPPSPDFWVETAEISSIRLPALSAMNAPS
jgi:hypothetical protein